MWESPSKTLLIMKFGMRWSRADFWNASRIARNMIMSVEHPVNILADLSLSFSTPQNVIHLTLSGMRSKADNTAKVAVISPTNLWLRLYQYLERAYPMDVLPVCFVETYEEAMTCFGITTLNTIDNDNQKPTSLGKSIPPFTQHSYV